MDNMKQIDLSKYKKLSEIDHVLLRPGRYLGTVAPQTQHTYMFDAGKVVWKDVTFSPAFVKLFDEIITNSVDFSKRAEGKHLNRIEITCSMLTGEISVYDNGGIPVVKHPDHDQWLPDMLLGELRSGSNFNDDDTDGDDAAGQNGEGASLAGIFSTHFHVTTADRKNKFERKYLNNFKERTNIIISPSKEGFTRIAYIPDYTRLGITLDSDHFAMIERRAYEVAACNPNLKVFFNSKRIDLSGFKDFVHLFDPEALYTESEKWQIGLGHSQDGFKHVAFVNSTLTSVGGTHVDYVSNKIVDEIRDHVEKKTKQQVKPSDIKNHFFLYINARVTKPRYSSQTKEDLKSDWKSWGVLPVIDDKFIKQVIKSKIVAEIIEWATRKKELEDLKALRGKMKEGKKKSFNDILKYEPAGEKNDRTKCTLIVCEGDSAAGPLLEARDSNLHGILPLRGKGMNVRDAKISEVKKNAELISLMRIIGLEIGVEPVISELRYGRLLIATDQDQDGIHIRGLIMNLFQTFWPSLLKAGYIHGLRTPIVRTEQNKKIYEFFSEDDYTEWQNKQTKPYTSKYLKGLGGNSHEHFRKYLASDDFVTQYLANEDSDFAALDIAFQHGKDSADIRKEWLFGDKTFDGH